MEKSRRTRSGYRIHENPALSVASVRAPQAAAIGRIQLCGPEPDFVQGERLSFDAGNRRFESGWRCSREVPEDRGFVSWDAVPLDVIAGREGAITGEMRRLMVSSILTVVALLAVLGLSSGRGSASAASWKRPPGGLEQ
jgi:hypothetical protein